VLGGTTDLAIGNVVGSNILNVLLILGLSALITPLVVNIQLIRQEVPIMIGASLLLLLLAFDGSLSRLDGALLFGLLLAYTGFLVVQSRRETAAAREELAQQTRPPVTGLWRAHPLFQTAVLLVGLGLLVLGSEWLVTAATTFARALGVSDVVIGQTVVAIGTSMPEVATCIAASLKGERDIAVGNVVGSNTINILGCLGLSGLVSGASGLTVPPSVLAFDIWVMLVVALACLPVFLTGREIARWEGGVFIAYYLAYVGFLVLSTLEHPALPGFSAAMLWFAVPLTLITLVVSSSRRRPTVP
jgi:cation:H+ antiporter